MRFFSGEGFILQSLQGTQDGDTAFLKAYGTVVSKELGEGETLRISSGCESPRICVLAFLH